MSGWAMYARNQSNGYLSVVTEVDYGLGEGSHGLLVAIVKVSLHEILRLRDLLKSLKMKATILI